MLSFQIGKTTVHLLPVLIFVLLILVTLIFIVIVKTKQMNSMKKLCQSGEYEKSILLAKKLLTYFTRSYKLYRVKSTKLYIENFHIWLAISYLGLSQYNMFWEHINKVEQQKSTTYIWIATYYILQKDVEQIKNYKEKIQQTEEMNNTIAFLNGIVLCEEGKTNEGQEILNELLPKLNYALTRQIVSNYIA